MRKKISTTIYVTPEQADKLKLLHERTKVPVAVYIREGIDLVLRHYAHMLPGQLALVPDSLEQEGHLTSSPSSPRPPEVSSMSTDGRTPLEARARTTEAAAAGRTK